MQTGEFLLDHAIAIIQKEYGIKATIQGKDKDLLKYGRNDDVEQDIATLMCLPVDIDNETYVETNIITQVSSSSTADTEVLTVEGHTKANGVYTFVVQDVTLTGQTAALLDTPLARISRSYAAGSTDLVGPIHFAETDALTAGVPDTDTKVHMMIRATKNQSEKGATTIEDGNFWIVTGFHGHMFSKAAAWSEVDIEVRLNGKIFREVEDVSTSDTHEGRHDFNPYYIIPPNSDVRLRGISDSASGRQVGGTIQGFLANTVT